ncbi:MAG: protein translocase subunit SecF [Caldilineales bacterium]|nr:protein translocase subunit SecF [Caldilineales bacterium]
MLKLIQNRRWYYLFSSLIIIPGLISIIMTWVTTGAPLRFSIDFTGGTLWEVQFAQEVPPGEIVRIFNENGSSANVNTIGDANTLAIRTDEITPDQKVALITAMTTAFGEAPEELLFRSVGPTIGAEVTRTAVIAVALTSLVILAFITWAFRNVPHPVRYGTAAILAMIHDVLLTIGVYSIMGWIAGWEVDALFLTALLTIIGFSVQDTIVVFDRIRENSRRHRGETYEVIVNRSLLETMQRSIATQINAMFVMIALLLFGGVTIKPFIATMLVGLLSGTYSSIFIASPILVSWEYREGFFRWLAPRTGRKTSTASA